MPLLKVNSGNEDEIKEIINNNIATSMKTQRQFSQLLMLNGCPTRKVGRIGSKIRKQLLKEAKNGNLTVDTVMPRAYVLIGEHLGISEVKTFEDMAIEGASNGGASAEERNSKLIKQNQIEEKFGIDLTNRQWFQCSIEEIKYSTFTNQPQRNIDTAYVVINDDNIEIMKESVWIKSNMGTRKIFFNNITSIDYDARGMLHASSSAIINTKSAEHIQLKFVNQEKFDMMNDAFEAYMEKTNNPQQTSVQQNVSTVSAADELLKYAELYERGLLTKEEFEMKKSQLLGLDEGSDNEVIEEESQDGPKAKFCGNCGTPVDEDSKFCMNCGAKLI